MTNESNGRSDETAKPHNTLFPKDMEPSGSGRPPLRGRWAPAEHPGAPEQGDDSGAEAPGPGESGAEPPKEPPVGAPPPPPSAAPPVPPAPPQPELNPLPLVAELRHAIDTLERLATALEAIDVLLHHETPGTGSETAKGKPSAPPALSLADLLSRRTGRGDIQDILRQYLLR